MNLACVNELLDSYNGRDKILRLIYYGINSVTGLCSRSTSNKLIKFNNHIDSCRTFLRLFDDLPMLQYTLSYGFGEEEPDILMQFCGICGNVLDQLYYPLEHIAWAADNGIVAVDSSWWWNASTVCWVLSVYLSFCKSLRYFTVLQSSKQYHSISNVQSRIILKELSKAQLNELLTMVKCLSDLIHAVHWLPPGILWSRRLKTWHIGLFGTVSSIITLYQTVAFSKKKML
ncbi:peroxisomal membrane protein 11C-like [Lycorma delicatula]|uniref:peroxisomal membrane protein 11C-like n=1 Tax=Lycorma delicatula TaxID=130591 RepID=UPI003F51702A